jgi:hypothetical protein
MLPKVGDGARQITQGSEASFFQRCAATVSDIVIIFTASLLIILCIPPLRRLLGSSDTLLRVPVFLGIFIAVGALYSFILADKMPG